MYFIPIAAFVTAYYLVNVVLWHVPLQRALKQKRVKPFDCVNCLSVWFAIFLYLLPLDVSYFLSLTFGAGFISTKIK
jgi:hypothetical protein